MKWILPVLFLVAVLNPAKVVAQKSVMDLPECLDNPYIRLNLSELLSKNCKKTANVPWVVYSDRGPDFGEKYYVVEETSTQVHIFSAAGMDGKKMINPVDQGMRSKSELLMHFSAELLEDKILHKKCVVLNRKELVDSIANGLLSDLEIPIYASPTSTLPKGHIPLYYMYFIYKQDKDNGRYLIGRNYRFQTFGEFHDQIFGWVDVGRVHLYNNRICFEPNYDRSAVAERRCDEKGAARVFEDPYQISKYFDGNSAIEPVWEEPSYYYLTKANYINDSVSRLVEAKTKELCSLSSADIAARDRIITEAFLPGSKFRFPLIEVKDNNTFLLGATGRYEDSEALLNTGTCENLKKNKKNINVFFLLDHTIPNFKSTYALHQIDILYTDFEKQYGVCVFPRTEIGAYKISTGDSKRGKTNYETVRDFISNYNPASVAVEDDNCLATLDYILQNENFDIQKTNIIVILNNSPLSEVAEKKLKKIEDNLVRKNCYVILFNYTSDESLTKKMQDIILNAANHLNSIYKEKSTPGFIRKGESQVLANAGLMAAIASRNPSINTARQVEEYFLGAYEDIVNAVDRSIQIICKNSGNVKLNITEDRFTKALRDIARGNAKVTSVHALVRGYSCVRVKGHQDFWKAEVLMTDTEIRDLAALLSGFSSVSNNPWNQAQMICELWKKICNRFVGQQIDDKVLMDMHPEQILTRLIGNTFGYSTTDPLKRYPLRKICSNDPDVQRYFAGYIDYVRNCSVRLDRIIADGSMRFDLSRISSDNKPKTDGNLIFYYWVPVEMLP